MIYTNLSAMMKDLKAYHSMSQSKIVDFENRVAKTAGYIDPPAGLTWEYKLDNPSAKKDELVEHITTESGRRFLLNKFLND